MEKIIQEALEKAGLLYYSSNQKPMSIDSIMTLFKEEKYIEVLKQLEYHETALKQQMEYVKGVYDLVGNMITTGHTNLLPIIQRDIIHGGYNE